MIDDDAGPPLLEFLRIDVCKALMLSVLNKRFFGVPQVQLEFGCFDHAFLFRKD